MNTIPFKRTLALGASMLAALAFAVPAFAGEDEDDDDSAPVTQQAPQSSGGGGGGGGSDSQHATGGVATGAGAMATVADDNAVLPLALLGGGALVLTASGLAFRRREDAV